MGVEVAFSAKSFITVWNLLLLLALLVARRALRLNRGHLLF